jgi:lipoprotein-anchoring transpeptidase ErfK/SrfK
LHDARVQDASRRSSRRPRRRGWAAVTIAIALSAILAACGGGHSTGNHGSAQQSTAQATTTAIPVRVSITPTSGHLDTKPDRGITVTAADGKITHVSVLSHGAPVTGKLNATGTRWHSRWALDVAQRYTVVVTAVGASGQPVTDKSAFRTFTPTQTFETRIVEGTGQTYGVGIPIVLYFSRPVTNRAAVERALTIKTSKPVVGSWYWDIPCNMAPACVYFRPKHYWRPHTRISFVGHLNGVQAAPGVYGHHTLTQSFAIGRSLIVVASTSQHSMNVFRDGKLFAHWPISSGRPGDDTPNGRYLTIEKANPVQMTGPGYSISVPWSVRFTWSGDYLHDAYWSVGEQGFTNVSHGCINMSPANAETYYNLAVPGDPVTVTGSPRAGEWGNGWTMWFLSWRQWVRGSALHAVVHAGPRGSRFVKA